MATSTGSGTLRITGLMASNMRDKELFGSQDPYVIFHSGDHSETTRAVTGAGESARWEETITLPVSSTSDRLHVEVWNKNRLRKDTLIASGTYELSRAMASGSDAVVIPLVTKAGKDCGELSFSLSTGGISSGIAATGINTHHTSTTRDTGFVEGTAHHLPPAAVIEGAAANTVLQGTRAAGAGEYATDVRQLEPEVVYRTVECEVPMMTMREEVVERPVVTSRREAVDIPSVKHRTEVREIPEIVMRTETRSVPTIVMRAETFEVPEIVMRRETVRVPYLEVREEVREIPEVIPNTETITVPQIVMTREVKEVPELHRVVEYVERPANPCGIDENGGVCADGSCSYVPGSHGKTGAAGTGVVGKALNAVTGSKHSNHATTGRHGLRAEE